MDKRKKKAVTLAVLAATLALLPSAGYQAVCSAASKDALAVPSGTAEQGESRVYENKGLRLSIPLKYDGLLLTETREKGRLFTVSEKASVLAEKALNRGTDGAGWLFSIGRMDERKFHEMLCGDMSGAEPFARDEEGNHYLFFHPTDVRYVREDRKAMERDQGQWNVLNQWAWESVRESFVKENKLHAESADNSDVGICLARVLYRPGMRYTVSTTEYGPIEPNGLDPAPYVEPLLYGAVCRYADASETPDGEYVVLSLPEEGSRVDFFLAEGKENYIRKVRDDGSEMLYKAAFADGKTRAGVVMKEWYEALAANRDMMRMGYTTDSLLGNWAEKIAGRGVIQIAKSKEKGKYDVSIHWSSSAYEMSVWTMTAEPAGSNAIRYKNGRHSILLFDEKGKETEKVQYTNGTGRFLLNSANELMWQDNIDHAGDNAVFVSAGEG